MKKNIQEQSAETNTSPEVFLKQALTNCFQIGNDGISQKYTWFKIDNNYAQLGTSGLVKLKDGRFAIKGFKIKDTKTGKQLPTPQDIYWFSDKTVLNATTGNQITWTPCPEITKTAGVEQNTTSLTPDQLQTINTMVNDQAWSKTKPADYDVYPSNYETFKKIPGIILYKSIGLKNTRPDQISKLQSVLTNKGYTLKQPDYGTKEYQQSITNPMTLGTILTQNEAKNLGISDISIKIYRSTNESNGEIDNTNTTEPKTNKDYRDLLKTIEKAPRYGSKQCQDSIEKLYNNSPLVTKKPRKFTPLTNQIEIEETKNIAMACIAQQGIDGFTLIRGYGSSISDMVTALTRHKGEYGLNYKYNLYRKSLVNPTNESEEKKLKNFIRENLIKTSENRKRILNEERSIVRERIILLAEKVNVKSKSSRENFCDELLGEMIYLNKQGFDKEVISEGVLDTIASMFGNSGEGILQTFKQRMAEWLVGKIMPGAEKSWMAGIIINVFTDTGILEIPKLTQCSFLTKKMAEAIVEEVPKQLQYSTGKTGFFWDTLRNSLLETLEESNFGQHLEKGLVGIVCPMLDKVKNKLSGLGDKIKTQTLGMTSKEKETDSSGSVEAG